MPTYDMIQNCIPDSTEDDIEKALSIKILHRHDNKLAEFSYKIFHNTLICGKILSKWTRVNKMCTICSPVQTHDIPHMLFNCKISKDIWGEIKTILDI